MRRSRNAMFSVLAIALALVLAACDGGGAADNAPEAASDVGQPAVTMISEGADAPAEEASDGDEFSRAALGSGGIEAVAFQAADFGRDIIFTADLTVAVNDVVSAGEEATRIVQSLGGFVFGQDTRGAPDPSTVLVFKIRPEDFQEALARLGAIGEVRSQTVSAEDVTDLVVDLDSRIATAEASVERLKGFLADASDIKTIAELESQLLDRETQLETLRGQLRTVRDRVDLATITVTLTEALAHPAVDLSVTSYPGHGDGGAACPGDGGITVDKGDDVTLCFEITNAGDTPLTDFQVEDTVLELTGDDLIVVFGDPEGTLQPGQSMALAAELTLDRSLRTQTRVTAIPVGPEGETLAAREVASSTTIGLTAVDPDGLPGFGDGLSAALGLLARVGSVAVVAAGAILPFLWVPVVAWLVFLWRRRRSDQDVDSAAVPAGDAG